MCLPGLSAHPKLEANMKQKAPVLVLLSTNVAFRKLQKQNIVNYGLLPKYFHLQTVCLLTLIGTLQFNVGRVTSWTLCMVLP